METNGKSKRLITIVKIICFFIVLFLILSPIQHLLQYRNRTTDNFNGQVANFYNEEKNTLDAVFIGSSACFSFYSPLLAYNSYGIKTANYCSSGMGAIAYKYVIEEVRKTQEDALIVLTVVPNEGMSYQSVHAMSDEMPLSLNKIRFLNKYFTEDGESIFNSFGFYFTLWEYHDRWSELKADDFKIDNIKGANTNSYYLDLVTDVTEDINISYDKKEVDNKNLSYIKDLLDYCDEKNENIVFLFPPRNYQEDKYEQTNTIVDMILDRGYEVLDVRDKANTIGLDYKHDYYDLWHTNIHGSIKYTDYLVNYILEKRNCNLDKKSDFELAFSNYQKIIDSKVLDVELNMKNRDYFLEAPELVSIEQVNNDVSINWNIVNDADGYCVYRKNDNGWEKVLDVSDSLNYVDGSCEKNKSYTYTVISYRNSTDKIYGNYDYKGLTIEVK